MLEVLYVVYRCTAVVDGKWNVEGSKRREKCSVCLEFGFGLECNSTADIP
jgi:hypothetical protein